MKKLRKKYKKLKAKNTELKADCENLNLLFDLRWKADMKAIKQWQEATERELVWPNHSDLCVWLLNQQESKIT